MMKVFTTTNFKGYYPVGTAAVIVAETEEEADRLLIESLSKMHLIQDEPPELKEVDTSVPHASVLLDGNY